jgi:hypothetical protein
MQAQECRLRIVKHGATAKYTYLGMTLHPRCATSSYQFWSLHGRKRATTLCDQLAALPGKQNCITQLDRCKKTYDLQRETKFKMCRVVSCQFSRTLTTRKSITDSKYHHYLKAKKKKKIQRGTDEEMFILHKSVI